MKTKKVKAGDLDLGDKIICGGVLCEIVYFSTKEACDGDLKMRKLVEIGSVGIYLSDFACEAGFSFKLFSDCLVEILGEGSDE